MIPELVVGTLLAGLILFAVAGSLTDQVDTPDRAEHLAKWWRWPAAVCGAVSAALWFLGFGDIALLPLIGVHLCFVQSAEMAGWRRGYLAREPQLRQEATPTGVRRD